MKLCSTTTMHPLPPYVYFTHDHPDIPSAMTFFRPRLFEPPRIWQLRRLVTSGTSTPLVTRWDTRHVYTHLRLRSFVCWDESPIPNLRLWCPPRHLPIRHSGHLSYLTTDPEINNHEILFGFHVNPNSGSPVNRVRSVLWMRTLSRKPSKGSGFPETLSFGTFTSVHPDLRSKLRRRRIRKGTAHKLRPHRLLRLRDQLGFRTLITGLRWTPLLWLLADHTCPGLWVYTRYSHSPFCFIVLDIYKYNSSKKSFSMNTHTILSFTFITSTFHSVMYPRDFVSLFTLPCVRSSLLSFILFKSFYSFWHVPSLFLRHLNVKWGPEWVEVTIFDG